MNILLSNDDGFKSLGLDTLRDVLDRYGKVMTFAPSKDISASSSCLSVHHSVKVKKISKNFYKVDGTPADCVHIGTRGIMKKYPDIVFSGINFGSNMGDDVIYSGTVGAAIEGRHAKYGAFAISIASKKPKYIHDIKKITEYTVDFIFSNLKIYSTIFNINVPNLPLSKIKGIKLTTLGRRKMSHKAKSVSSDTSNLFEIGKVGAGILGRGTDFYAVSKGYISVTPITINMTDTKIFDKLKKKL